jgi:ribosomal RNA methyltransferase Nop2
MAASTSTAGSDEVEDDTLPRMPNVAFDDDAAEMEYLQNAATDSEEDEDADMDALEDADEEGVPSNSIHSVKSRLASAVQALKSWKVVGPSLGKSRSQVYEQFISDVCQYYGYNPYLAEKLVELFPIDEVSLFLTSFARMPSLVRRLLHSWMLPIRSDR